MSNRPADVRAAIAAECDAIKEMLLAKNAAYGNSALDPVRIFSKAAPEEQIRVRLDDKLSRLARGSACGEDVELDLVGYLILLRVLRKKPSGLAAVMGRWPGDESDEQIAAALRDQ